MFKLGNDIKDQKDLKRNLFYLCQIRNQRPFIAKAITPVDGGVYFVDADNKYFKT